MQKDASILQPFNDKLLIGNTGNAQFLYIYSREGLYISNITIIDYAFRTLIDATWTPRGNIIYASYRYKVVVVSVSGDVICSKLMVNPSDLSVSYDDVIYVSDLETGVHQSKDDGASWSEVFKSSDGWQCLRVIKVVTEHRQDFWAIETTTNYDDYRLRKYSINSSHTDGNITGKNVNLTGTVGRYFDLRFSRLACDDQGNIFFNDYVYVLVHVILANGQSYPNLLPSLVLKNPPCSQALDNQRKIMYVGQVASEITAFNLIYSDTQLETYI